LKNQVADLEAREQALKSENRHLRDLYDQAPLSYQSLDENGCFIEVNQAWLDTLGYSREEVLGKNFGDFLHPDWKEHFRENFPRFKAIGEVLGVEFEMVKKDGSTMLVSFNGKIGRDHDGQFKQTHCIFRDITLYNRVKERSEAERKLLQICHTKTSTRELMSDLADFFQKLTGCGAVGLRMRQGEDFPYYETRGFPKDFVMAENSLCTPDLKGDLLCDSTGNPVLECMCGNVICERFDPAKPFFTKNGSFWTNSTSELLASTSEADRQSRTRNRCNGEGYESVALMPLRSGGKTYGLLQLNDPRRGRFTLERIEMLEHFADHVALAIAKHMADEELRNSEEKFRTLSALAPVGIYLTSPEGNCQYVNKFWCEMAGMSPDEALGSGWVQGLHPEDRDTVCSAWKKMVDSGGHWGLEYRFKTQEEKVTWVYGLAAPQYDAAGRIARYIGINMDISERKKMEVDLRESEMILRSFIDAIPESAFMIDPDGTVLLLNKITAERLGKSMDDMPGRNIYDLIPEDISRSRKLIVDKVLQTKTSISFEDKRLNRHIYNSINPVLDENGNIAGLAVVGVDITDRRQAEDALRKSEEKYRLFVEMASKGLWAIDGNYRTTFVNRQMAEMLGYTIEEMQGKSVDYYMFEEDLNDHRKKMEERKQGGGGSYERRFRHKDGREVWTHVSATATRNNEGLFIGSHAFFTDITERKKAEEALREGEATYRTLVTGLPDVVMRFDRDGRHLFVSDNVNDMVDLQAGQFIGKTHRELDFPETQCKLWEDALIKVFDSGAPYETEFAFEGKNGPAILNWRLVPESDNNGKVRSVLSISRDITSHRRAEQNYRILFREMLDGFALHEIICDTEGNPADYRFLAVNPAFERMTNMKEDDILGRTILEIMPGIERYWIETYGGVALTGEPVFFENYSADLKKHFEVTAFRSEPNQFACIFADITERRLAEEGLFKKTEDLSRYNKMMVGRELKMIQLKKEINALLKKYGEKEKYNIHEIQKKKS